MQQAINDDNARWLYQLLIGRSWEDPKEFERWQGTWNNLAEALGIASILDNGHGRILWRDRFNTSLTPSKSQQE